MQTLKRKCMVGPSILSADFAFLHQDCQEMIDIGAKTLHIDIMDGYVAYYLDILYQISQLELQLSPL